MREAFFIPHLGLGDHIICNGIVRMLRKEYDIVHMPVKHHNYDCVSDMFRDDDGIELISVRDDHEAIKYLDIFRPHVEKIIGVGNYGPNFLHDAKSFDESFYKQLNLSYDLKWSYFKYQRDNEKENALLDSMHLPESYIFVHDDKHRNYEIDNSHFPKDVYVFRPTHMFGEKTNTTIFVLIALLRAMWNT